jgi:pimeloyl-ACP methyl ester carboxylesterase
VALAPAGGWAEGDESFMEALQHFRTMAELLQAAAPHAEAIMSTSEGRRRATAFSTANYEHIPAELLAHQLRGAAACDALEPLLELGLNEGWPLDAEAIRCPVRVVWGTGDQILPWPRAAARYRDAVLPMADWVELDGVGHLVQLDVPVVAAELVLSFTR